MRNKAFAHAAPRVVGPDRQRVEHHVTPGMAADDVAKNAPIGAGGDIGLGSHDRRCRIGLHGRWFAPHPPNIARESRARAGADRLGIGQDGGSNHYSRAAKKGAVAIIAKQGHGLGHRAPMRGMARL